MSSLVALSLLFSAAVLFLPATAILPHPHLPKIPTNLITDFNINFTVESPKYHVKRPNHHHSHRRSMASQFLLAHNVIRSHHKLQALKWNRTLTRYARRWANQRAEDCQLVHSPNSPYGENMFWSKKGHWTPVDVVRTWAAEYQHYNQATNECVGDNVCGHYTQIIWRNTKFLGCGRVECVGDQGFLYVCSYDPPGNFYFEGPLGGRFAKSIVYPPPPSIAS